MIADDTAAPRNGFNAAAGTAVPISIRLTDDCNTPVTTGSVQATFSNNESAVNLTSAGGGTWTGSWTPRAASASSLLITITARQPVSLPSPFGQTQGELRGTKVLTGSIAADASIPLLFSGGAISAASYDPSAGVVGGSYLALFGRGLAGGTAQASSLPLATTLNGTSVEIAGRPMPLLYVSENQINGVVPFDVPLAGEQIVVVRRSGQVSAPLTLRFTPVEPALFSVASNGRGQGTVVNAATNVLADAGSPVTAGDYITIYATGLGPVDPPLAAGAAAPASPLSNVVGRVTVTIGGIAAPVSFAGLAPGFAQLYQVNAVVPQGIQPGSAVPLVVAVDVQGLALKGSNTVTIAVR